MRDMIYQWVDNVHRYGFYTKVIRENGTISFVNDKADFESEQEFNQEMAAQIAFEDRHKRF